MKSLSELQDYFYEKIYPELDFLEQKRLRIYKELKVWAISLTCSLLFISFLLKDLLCMACFLALLALFVGIFSFVYKLKISGFASLYKDQLIQKLITFISQNLFYQKSGFISSYEYKKSKIFPTPYDRYQGDDLVQGEVGGVALKFSELHTQVKKRRKNTNYWADIFQGLFFVADFHKDFQTETVLLPDNAEKFIGSFSHFFQSFSARGKLIKLDNPEFERNFVIYSGDQVEARYILSHSLMENILLLKSRVQKELFISFVGSKIYIAIPFSKPLFEPKIYKKVTSFSEVRFYFDILSMALSIVDILKLDQRIWSKR